MNCFFFHLPDKSCVLLSFWFVLSLFQTVPLLYSLSLPLSFHPSFPLSISLSPLSFYLSSSLYSPTLSFSLLLPLCLSPSLSFHTALPLSLSLFLSLYIISSHSLDSLSPSIPLNANSKCSCFCRHVHFLALHLFSHFYVCRQLNPLTNESVTRFAFECLYLWATFLTSTIKLEKRTFFCNSFMFCLSRAKIYCAALPSLQQQQQRLNLSFISSFFADNELERRNSLRDKKEKQAKRKTWKNGRFVSFPKLWSNVNIVLCTIIYFTAATKK